MTLDWRTLPSIIEAPKNPREYDGWLESMRAAEGRCRQDLALDRAPVSRPELDWAESCFVCAKWMTWDRRFLDAKGRLEPQKFLADARERFGGYDGVVLWQAYPRIGFDDRNQFDFYRDLEGGEAHLRSVTRDLKAAGVRVFVAYNPWDVGTRREPVGDGLSLRKLADAIDADGVFLDTLREGGGELRTSLLEGPRPMALESELDLPPTALADHALSWMQWPNPPTLLGVLRNTWLARGHMQHVIRRWHRDHKHEMFLAWLNGAGMLVWENIFGSWNGWSAEDARMVRQMRTFYQAFAHVFRKGERRPCVPLWPNLLSSEWNDGETAVWTIVNPTSSVIPVQPLSPKMFDGFSGREHRGPFTMPPYSIAALCTRPPDTVPDVEERQMPFFSIRSLPIPRDSGKHEAHLGVAEVRAAAGTLTARYRVREPGDYAYANFLDQSYPGLHSIHQVSQVHPEIHFAIDVLEVTNSQFARFLQASGYEPVSKANFLLHWKDGKPAPGSGDQPVVYVDLDDARAYAKWQGMRLPTEWEWQVAMAQHKIHRASPLVWNWTESEHTDGMTSFAMLKGGCEKKVVGSDWYADGGPQEPDFIAKFIRISPSLDRCATIGFRCAMDL